MTKNKKGQESVAYQNSWVTDLEVTEAVVATLVKGGRCRWKIENECFNTLKNQGVRHGSALKNPQKTEQGSEYKTLRWIPYLDSKERGDNSMVIKQELSENVYDKDLQHLSDMVKAKLPKFQFSVVCF